MNVIIAYDIGTTGVKTCLFGVDKTINLLGSASMGYDLFLMPDGGAEQDQDQWWTSMCVRKRWKGCPSVPKCRDLSWWIRTAFPSIGQ